MLYEMIVKGDIQERLSEKEQEFATQGDQAMVKEYSQIYGMIMELFDKMVQMLGSETITGEGVRTASRCGISGDAGGHHSTDGRSGTDR